MEKLDKGRLIRAAARAREFAQAPYSQFFVGAALLTAGGKLVTGANVESASYGLTCCAERVALFKALTDGETRFRAIGIVAQVEGGPVPCGACRQLLAEYAPRLRIYMADHRKPGKISEASLKDLLPRPFLTFSRGTECGQRNSLS